MSSASHASRRSPTSASNGSKSRIDPSWHVPALARDSATAQRSAAQGGAITPFALQHNTGGAATGPMGNREGSMKRVFAYQGHAVLRDVPEPDLRPNHVLVQTAFSAISAGTEGWIVRGTADPTYVNHEYPDPNEPG